MKRLNDRQVSALKRIVRGGDGGAAVLPETAKQLEKRGLVFRAHPYQRCEWGKVVATLMVCVPDGVDAVQKMTGEQSS